MKEKITMYRQTESHKKKLRFSKVISLPSIYCICILAPCHSGGEDNILDQISKKQKCMKLYGEP